MPKVTETPINTHRTKKLTTLTLAQIYFKISELSNSPTEKNHFTQRAKKLQECGTRLTFKECPKGHKESNKLTYANFCRLRLCPMCQWRKTLFIFQHFLKVAHKVQENNFNCQFIFITLTGKNVSANNLNNEIDRYLKSFAKWLKYKTIKLAILGTFRTLEITYNEKENTFHPHLHIIGIVKKNYFSKNYISQETLGKTWRKAFKADYTPVVDIRKIRKRDKNKTTIEEELRKTSQTSYDTALAAAAAEVAKYNVKIKPLLTEKNSAQIIETLDLAMQNRRFIAYTGIFKNAYQQLNTLKKEFDLLDINETDKLANCTCSICQSELVNIHHFFDHNLHNYLVQN